MGDWPKHVGRATATEESEVVGETYSLLDVRVECGDDQRVDNG